MSSYQELFDKATTAILQQGCRSVNPAGQCRYRGPNNLKCAIGHLISDEQINIYGVQEGYGAGSFPIALIRSICAENDVYRSSDFLHGLQKVHDLCKCADTFLDDFRIEANDFARRWELKGIK